MKRLALTIAALALATPAFAQQPPSVVSQVNQTVADTAAYSAQIGNAIAVMRVQIIQDQAQIGQLSMRIAELEKHIAATKTAPVVSAPEASPPPAK